MMPVIEPPPPSYEQDVESLTEQFGNAMAGEDSDETHLIVALDFGTTYSGVAYAFSNKPEAIYTIEDWPGAGGRTYSKCPTLIEYTDDKNFRWGFEVDRTSSKCIEGIKLLLDPDQPKPIYAPRMDTDAELRRIGKTAMAVASDYIAAIYQHAIQTIEKKVPRNYLKIVPRKFVMSVPAIWSEKAKDVTLRAARNAGISGVKLVKEPEAAALFTIHSMGEKGLKVGDALVLCDAGGGTVDLIAYEILNLTPFELGELTICTGGLAGSLLVNKRFEEWIRDVVGDLAYIKLRETDAYRAAMKDFDDRIKPGFRSKADATQYVTFPGADLDDNPDKGLKRDSIAITGPALFGIFDPIFREVDRLVKEQVSSARINRMEKGKQDSLTIKAIFMVGGFGSNKYIYDQVTKAHPKVQVIQPNDAWAAIVRGAVMFQLPTEASVVASIAPKHYGVAASSTYNETQDAGEDKYWCREEQRWLVTKMTWYIEKGDDLDRSRKIEFPFYRTFKPNPTHAQLQVEEVLLECNLDDKPDYPSEDAVTRNCSLSTDLSKVPQELFRKRSRTTPEGEKIEWWDLNYKLMITIQSGPMLFSIQVGETEYGQASAEY